MTMQSLRSSAVAWKRAAKIAALARISALRGRRIYHFIHIGKTGGTSIRRAIAGGADTYVDEAVFVGLHGHEYRLSNVEAPEKVFFCIRDPVSRFVSAFYSRKREGRPRLRVAWSVAERRAFLRFLDANDLAEALTSPNGSLREAAWDAMNSVGHMKNSYWRWLVSVAEVAEKRDLIVGVLRQENLVRDFEVIKERIGLPSTMQLPADPIGSHKNDYSKVPALSNKAIENIRRWYSKDYDAIYFIKKSGLFVSDTPS